MHHAEHLAVIFAVSLGAVIVVALLFRIGGRKLNYRNIVAIPVTITAVQALRLMWPMSNLVFLFILGAAMGVAVYAAQFVRVRRNA